MDLTYFTQSDFYRSLQRFFEQINIPINYLTAAPATAQDILTSAYNPNNPAHQLINNVYVVGGVDDDIFRQNASTIDMDTLKQQRYAGLLIFGVTLNRNGKLPTRTQMAEITRALNREFLYTPVVTIFRYDRYLSFAHCERLPYKQAWREGEKVGKVSLLKDIDLYRPHTGHLKILDNLRIERTGKQAITSFEALYQYWQNVLSVSLLNKRFYQEVSNWYFWAVQQVEFPDDAEKDRDIRNATNVIRLLTRLIFVWFLKEKHLIPETLFEKQILDKYLKYDDATGSTYYKAILQNLFFATLNTEMQKDNPKSRQFVNRRYGIQEFYRYSRFFQEPEKALELFEEIPFLNGGLFENLDKNIGTPEEVRVDCFSDRRDNETRLKVPDVLFFGDEEEIDLSDVYGDTKRKHEKVKGLINILNSYKFTITENTPIEEEIALDPELLGKVFENLLASYNPETQTTARKQTGSFYTPREIVNYMVDESLIAYLENHLQEPLPQPFPDGEGSTPPSFGGGSGGRSDGSPRFFHTSPENWKILKEFARNNRKNPTEAENILWQHLRKKQLGYRFRRQHAIGEFIADFVCIEKKLVVEVDGAVHECQQAYDEARTQILQQYQFRVIRFWNWEVKQELQRVLRTIREELEKPHPQPQEPHPQPQEPHPQPQEPHPQPLPDGEGSTPPSFGGGPGGRCSLPPSEGAGGKYSPSPSERARGRSFELRLRHLISYSEEPHQFSAEEVHRLIHAIDNAKILDPACGSGAFPMGMLHKMVHLLNKLDPQNAEWKERQIAKVNKMMDDAERIEDTRIREQIIADLEKNLDSIEDAFQNNELDYGRKLYLIENGIYGVDIQPIAVQIAKLRFFISLIVDQKVNPDKPNLGIRPLPNLETKFVAANTLIGIEKPAQMMLRNPEIDKKELELKQVRQRHFEARTPKTKEKYRQEDERLRSELAELLKKDGFPSDVTEQLAQWNPYDQNASAGFFDSEWMFGIQEGFDIVLGNPPYFQLQKMKKERVKLAKQQFETFTKSGDLYCLFYEKGIQVLKENGVLCYITSNSWMQTQYGELLRTYLAEHTNPLQLLNFEDAQIFESAIVESNILLTQKTLFKNNLKAVVLAENIDKTTDLADYVKQKHIVLPSLDKNGWIVGDPSMLALKQKIEHGSILLKEWNIELNRGLTLGFSNAFIINTQQKDNFFKNPSNQNYIKPLLRGRDIQKFSYKWNDCYLIVIKSGWTNKHHGTNKPEAFVANVLPELYNHLKQVGLTVTGKGKGLFERDDQGDYWWELRKCAYYGDFEKPKIVWGELSNKPKFAYDEEKHFLVDTVFMMTGESLKYLLAILNSHLSEWYFEQISTTSGMGTNRWKKYKIEQMPIKKIFSAAQQPFETLVDQILATKQHNPKADTSDLERRIDLMVYKLYDLTYNEVKIVDPDFALSEDEYQQFTY